MGVFTSWHYLLAVLNFFSDVYKDLQQRFCLKRQRRDGFGHFSNAEILRCLTTLTNGLNAVSIKRCAWELGAKCYSLDLGVPPRASDTLRFCFWKVNGLRVLITDLLLGGGVW